MRWQRLAVVRNEPAACFRIDQRPPLEDVHRRSVAPTKSCVQIPPWEELRQWRRLTSTASTSATPQRCPASGSEYRDANGDCPFREPQPDAVPNDLRRARIAAWMRMSGGSGTN